MNSPLPPTLSQVCAAALRLPCSPSLLPRLAQALQSDESSATEIEQLISLDSSLAAATLRLANSATFSRGTIDTVEAAVFRLGAKEIYRLAALVLVSRWETPSIAALGWEPGDFCRKALCTAIAAEVLATTTERLDPQLAYTAGLVCDLGKLALSHSCGEFYGTIRAERERLHCTWEQAEHAVLGYHHAEVTSGLLRAWNFPAIFTAMAEFMTRPSEAPSDTMPLLSHLHAAKYLATAMGPGANDDSLLTNVHGAFLREWGFTAELLDAAMPTLLERAAERLGENLTHGLIKVG
ncbi:MAG: HDOD domain-containing protein [Candidatus Didemnitutus sp.]|nr:HDOD domain-containing protein [Candidatus Didemnitutus sp.]